MKIPPTTPLFGLSRALGSKEAESLASFLFKAWRLQRGCPPAALEGDLSYLARYFSPTLTGRKLREAVAVLPKLDIPRPAALTDEVFLDSPSGRGLVTPEGRVLLHLLSTQRDLDLPLFANGEVAWAYSTVAQLYQSWSRERVLEALGIKIGALRLPVIAFNLVLLVNGSVGEENALSIPPDEAAERQLSRILGPIIDSFVESLNIKRLKTESFRLRGGWVLSETRRHLFDYVSFTAHAIWILRSAKKPLVQRLGRELAERNKDRSRHDVEQAFEVLVQAYARARPALASRELVHERSGETRAIRDQLLAQYEHARKGILEE